MINKSSIRKLLTQAEAKVIIKMETNNFISPQITCLILKRTMKISSNKIICRKIQ